MKQMTRTFFLFVAGILPLALQATVWRVNNNSGASANFATFDAAISSASVLNGDTIYLEGSATSYTNSVTINKRLTVIGTGYFLSSANDPFTGLPGNTGLQANTNNSRFSNAIRWDSLAHGSRFTGIEFGDIWADPRADSIVFERCRFSSLSWNLQATAGQRVVGMRINKCYFNSTSIPTNFNYEGLEITNCIITGTFSLPAANTISALVRNNFFSGGITIHNTYFANNISINIGVGSFNATSSIIRNNISQFANVFPAGNGNQGNFTIAALILNTGTSDGRYRLAVGSPAIAAGETVGGITPDCGPFGTADPYRLSGIPPIPTVYSLTVPGSVPAASTSMNITLSTRSNN